MKIKRRKWREIKWRKWKWWFIFWKNSIDEILKKKTEEKKLIKKRKRITIIINI